MKLYTLKKETEFVALWHTAGGFLPIKAVGLTYNTMNELIGNITDEEIELLKSAISSPEYAKSLIAEDDGETKVLSPIPSTLQDIICLGVNYKEHIDETKDVADFTDKKATVYFSKRGTCIIGDGDYIPNYDFVDSLDYEVELGVILGKEAKNVSSEEALEYIFGYTIINDISARNLQFTHSQWYRGKSLDGHTAMGPCIITKDEIENVQNLKISCKVNDEIRQDSNTSLMIQSVAKAIEEISTGMTLRPATVIATGTPGGVGLGMEPPMYLKSKDKVECIIEGIGSITNIVQ